ncbi:MAG TPA: B12-binding domain-containing radical SAM protein [Syntrophobacteraceae bacterium]|nr:B12-binding domain-containing radical SAM protein [Syntrophobacteraceae bacterium]
MPRTPFVLLVNPWITDFAAYDLWSKPLGLLTLASLLRENGIQVALVDCLDRYDPFSNTHPDMKPGVSRSYGTGKYPKMKIEKPSPYRDFPRFYYRHGIHPESFRQKLRALPKPDLIWVTSMMTYWYPGVQQTIGALRDVFAEIPIWLGGVYARLCEDHARRTSGADLVVTDPLPRIGRRVEDTLQVPVRNKDRWGDLSFLPSPAWDLVPLLEYVPILAGRGCPFRCPYCASARLEPRWERRSGEDIHREISRWHGERGVVDFAFYDDALLLHAESSLRPALERLCRDGVALRFHTPNAVHVRALTPEWCDLLFAGGFTTLRLGLETTQPQRHRQWGGKVEADMFEEAVRNLARAGFSKDRIGVYLLCGAPGQSPREVADAVNAVRREGLSPFLAEYSPVPGSPMWKDAVQVSSFDIENEPLYHNNSFFACRRADFSYRDLLELKDLALQARRAVSGAENAPGGDKKKTHGPGMGP